VKFTTTPIPPTDQGEQFIYGRIENTKELTAQSLANKLNASTILNLSVATYTAVGATIQVKYKTPGTAGNSYTLATTTAAVTVSGATQKGGGTTGTGAPASLYITPTADTDASVAAYLQQLRVYAASLSEPDT